MQAFQSRVSGVWRCTRSAAAPALAASSPHLGRRLGGSLGRRGRSLLGSGRGLGRRLAANLASDSLDRAVALEEGSRRQHALGCGREAEGRE
jgi:hypothetical protein